MRKSYLILFWLSLVFLFVSCNNKEETIVKIPVVENKYDPSKPTVVDEILPIRGIIDQTFILNGNFPGELSDMKVYFDNKRAIITATDGISITGLIPKQKEGLNQVSIVMGTDSLVPASLTFKYKQSRSVKTISGKLGKDAWLSDAAYAGALLDAVTYGEVHFAVALKGQRLDNIFMIESGWGNRLFLLSQDDNKIQKLATPDALCHPAVNSTRDAFYVTQFHSKARTIYYYSKANSWEYATTGIKIPTSDLGSARLPSMTFGENDNLLYLMDVEGRIAEADLLTKTYKVYTSKAKKPSGINAANYGGEIKGDLPTSFGDWEDAFLTYSKYHKCFFASFANQHAIYKLVKNADNSWTSTLYAGNNGRSITMGHRLVDAKLNRPVGLVVNVEGEIFVCNKGDNPWDANGHVIVKIAGDVVELVAGKPTQKDPLSNGDPLEATFSSPRTLSIDSDGNYIIAAGEDRTVRKLSIE